MPLHDFTVYDMFEMNARCFADKTAITDQQKSLSFQALFDQSSFLARGMADRGITRGDRIAVLAMNSVEYILLYGAAAVLGAVVVPLNWRLSDEEIQYILEDANASFLFFDETQRQRAESIGLSHGTSLRLISLDNASSTAITPLQELMATQSPLSGQANSDDIFCLIYTAAVEGKPRGAALSHSNIVYSNIQTTIDMKIDSSDAYLNMLPLFHITGINLAFSVLHMGGKNVVMEKFNASKALAAAEQEKITLMASFPPILTSLMDEMDKQAYDLSSLKHVTGIDSPDNISKFTRQTDAVFKILYGQSETSGFVSLGDSSEAPGSAGKQCVLSKISIRDDNDRNVPSHETGEICVRGPIVFQGFWDNGNLDRSSFRSGWHHTGDNGRIDKNGFLWFEGRKPEKELIKPGGENVYPAEVEQAILEHPEILETCVIGVPDPRFGEGVKAVCVRAELSTLGETDLIEFVGQRIARYKKPGYVSFVASLPKNDKGGIDRKRIKELYSNQ
ncbi:MAG TPA: AMP-binding protein [Desulfobacteraceae bacterium]|nr:AMP-binding protein [Desulfobacteraceae bacterium]